MFERARRTCGGLRFFFSRGAAGPSLAARRLRALLAEPKVTIGGGFISGPVVIALFAPLIAPKNPLDQDFLLSASLLLCGLRRGPSPAVISAPTISAATCFRG